MGRLRMKRRAVRIGLGVLPVLALLGLAIYAVWVSWGIGGDVQMSGHGLVALLLGVLFSLLLGGVLIGLLLYSRRHGHDR
jgi:hypothetical protein